MGLIAFRSFHLLIWINVLTDIRSQDASAVKQIYENELNEARLLIRDLSRMKSDLEIRNQNLQEQMQDMQRQLNDAKKYRNQDRDTIAVLNQKISDLETERNVLRRTVDSLEAERIRDNASKYCNQDRDTIARLNQQISDLEAEINLLRRTPESLEIDRSRDRNRIMSLEAEVDKLRLNLSNETLARVDAENKRQTLKEEMEFLKRVHEQELKELAALVYRDTTGEDRDLSQLVQVNQIRGDMD